MSWLEPLDEVENCYLTTIGRRTGKAHEIEIWFGVLDGTLYLISGNGPTRGLVPQPDRRTRGDGAHRRPDPQRHRPRRSPTPTSDDASAT